MRGWAASRCSPQALSLVVLLYGGRPFLVGAWRAAKVRRATMDTLVVLGTWSAWLYSVVAAVTGSGGVYFESAAMITTLVLLGRLIEALGRRGATRAIESLAAAPQTEVWLLPGGDAEAEPERAPLETVRAGRSGRGAGRRADRGGRHRREGRVGGRPVASDRRAPAR